MTVAIRPLETVYNGYRFRSRLEARWAVFFETVGIEYRYESQDHVLRDGTRYLPDFYLPQYQIWVEIKGQAPTEDERRKAGLLAAKTGQWVDIFWPEPWHTMQIYGYRSRMPEHLAPEALIYIDLALSCGHWRIAEAITRDLKWCYWGDVAPQILKQGGWHHVPNPDDAPYIEWTDAQLELCQTCEHLVFGTKERTTTYPQMIGIKLDVQNRTYDFTTAWNGDDAYQIVEIDVPEIDPYHPGWCHRCENGEGDKTHPRLVAAYTAARSARFEFGESGVR